WKHLKDLMLADDDPTGSSPIDIIIGADTYDHFIQRGIRKGPIGQPIAQRSHFGWILSGPAQAPTNLIHKINAHHCFFGQNLRRSKKMNQVSLRKNLSPAEEFFANHLFSTHLRNPDSRFKSHLPFKGIPLLDVGQSRKLAIQRLIALKRR
ncbi:hypothetical protein EAG_05513, partial [Camponotus floridanus]